MRTLLLVLFFFTLTAVAGEVPAVAAADTIATDTTATAAAAQTEDVPQTPEMTEEHVEVPMTSTSFSLSLCVLGFGLLLIIGEIILVYRLNISPQDTIKFIIVTLIVIGSLYLITAGYTNDQIAPAMGLLGTIAGYLLGKMGPESASNSNNSNTNA